MTSRPLLRTSRGDVSARKTYDLIDEPAGPEYEALLDAALTQCATLVLTAPADAAAQALEALQPFEQQSGVQERSAVRRYAYNRESAEVLKRLGRSLYSWRLPELPENLCLLRNDGSPWLVSIAAQRLGYLELTPFEKLLLGRAAPGLAAVLAHQAALDAMLAYLERRYESHVETLAEDLQRYASPLLTEAREQVVEAIAAWLESGEEARVLAALDVVRALELHELHREVRALLHRASDDQGLSAAFRNNLLLRERHRLRRRRASTAADDALTRPLDAAGA